MQSTVTKTETAGDVKKFLRVKEAAVYLGVSAAHVYRMTERRLIPHYKSRGGKVIYFAIKDLDEYITHTYVMPASELE